MRLRKLWLKAGDQKKCLEIWGCQISNTKRKYGFNLKGTNVTVNAVLPCPTVTDATKDMFEQIAKEHKVPVEEAPAVFIWGKRPSSFKGLPPRKKSPIWWSMWQALYLQLQQALHCGLTAVRWTPVFNRDFELLPHRTQRPQRPGRFAFLGISL